MAAAGNIGERALTIASYAVCGFGNIASLGITIGVFSGLAPNQKSVIARLGPSALICGICSTCMSAAIAGMLVRRAFLFSLGFEVEQVLTVYIRSYTDLICLHLYECRSSFFGKGVCVVNCSRLLIQCKRHKELNSTFKKLLRRSIRWAEPSPVAEQCCCFSEVARGVTLPCKFTREHKQGFSQESSFKCTYCRQV